MIKGMLSIAIPSKTERFLEKTIRDVLKNATGNIEVFPILDGYNPPAEEIVDDPRVHYIHFEPTRHAKKRQGINHVAEISSGEYIMSLDAHCMMSYGFDEVLLKDIEDDWVVVPRRQRLDAENWCLQTQVDNRPPIDYEYLMWPLKFDPPSFHGFKWDARTLERCGIMIDSVMEIQGSAWVQSKKWFRHCGFMQVEGYQGWGSEGEELVMQTLKMGGQAMVVKEAEIAHLHKGSHYGRFYHLDRNESRASYKYSYDFWVHKNRDFFVSFIERFMPIPGWPSDWESKLYG
jgi:hypothetical protein